MLTRFYDALSRRDGETMAFAVRADAIFEDEVYRVEGADVGKMWRGLMSKAKTLTVSYTIARAGSGTGHGRVDRALRLPGRRPRRQRDPLRARARKRIDRAAAGPLRFPPLGRAGAGTKGKLFGRFEWFRRVVSRKAAKRVGVPPKR